MKKNVTKHRHMIDSLSCYSEVEALVAPDAVEIEVVALNHDNKTPKTFGVDSKKVRDWLFELLHDYEATGRKVILSRNVRKFCKLVTVWGVSESTRE